MKILYFFLFLWVILPSWIRICNLNADPEPDPATQNNADPCGSGSKTLIKSQKEVTKQYQESKFFLLFLLDGRRRPKNIRIRRIWIRVRPHFRFGNEIETEAKISFRLEAKKKPGFTWFTSMQNTKIWSKNESKISEN